MTLAFKARVNDPAIASFRYRVLQPIAFLSERGHEVELYDETRFEAYDAVVFSKAYKAADQALAGRLREAGKQVLLDLCDDHFFNPGDEAKYRQARTDLLAMIGLCDAVVCSTPTLAEIVQQEAGLDRTPAVAPDAYEQAARPVGPPTPQDRPARLLWFGRHGAPNAEAGMGDLLRIRHELEQAHAKRPVELVVCSDSRERFEQLFAGFPVPTTYVEWSPESFAVELGAADAVLIPLSDNRFVSAKTHNRLSLALSAGAPVVADRLASYEPFAPYCWLGAWANGLEAVLMRPEEARARAAAAKPYLEAHWSERAVAPQWEAALGLKLTIELETGPAPTSVGRWLAAERRAERPWLLAGETASAAEVARARAEGFLVMALGAAFIGFEADLAYAIDAETLARDPEALVTNARVLLVPAEPHGGGWAAGRSLDSWAVDLPVLRQFRDEDRLIQFELWTGAAGGLMGDVEGEEIPLRLLAQAGVRTVRALGLAPPPSAAGGFEGLASILERNGLGVTAAAQTAGLSFAPYEGS